MESSAAQYWTVKIHIKLVTPYHHTWLISDGVDAPAGIVSAKEVGVETLITRRTSTNESSIIGLDLAKNTLQAHITVGSVLHHD